MVYERPLSIFSTWEYLHPELEDGSTLELLTALLWLGLELGPFRWKTADLDTSKNQVRVTWYPIVINRKCYYITVDFFFETQFLKETKDLNRYPVLSHRNWIFHKIFYI